MFVDIIGVTTGEYLLEMNTMDKTPDASTAEREELRKALKLFASLTSEHQEMILEMIKTIALQQRSPDVSPDQAE